MENQSKFFTFLEKTVMGPMGKLAQFKFVRAITAAGMASVPFTIVGSMFLVLNILPLTLPTFIADLIKGPIENFAPLYMLANHATMGIFALYFCLGLGYELTRIYAEEDELDLTPLNGALLSMFAFFMTLPQMLFKDGVITRVTDLKEGSYVINGYAIGDTLSRLGTTGIFTAILMAVIAVQLYRLCVAKKWVIKMHEAVPLGVSRGFTALIPAFLVAVVVLLIDGLFISLGTDIFNVVAIPFGFVTTLTNSWLGLMVIYFLTQALWVVGIHGANIIFAFVNPIALANMTANVNGGNIPLAGEFSNMFVVMGVSGSTLGLTIFLAYLAKSEQLKAIGKAALVPGIFNINEPLIFGLPIIYNPYIAIPFFLAPMVAATIGYFAISLQFVNPVIAQMPWPSPIGIGAYLGTAGDWRAVIVALICGLASFLVYLPFIRIYDNMLAKQEKEQVTE